MTVGTILFSIGWFFLAGCGVGTSHTLNSAEARYQSTTAILNMLLSGSSCALICFGLKRHVVIGDHQRTPRYDIRSICNGFLAGMCAVTPGSGIFRPYAALIIGLLESICYMVFALIFKRVKLDDPMEYVCIFTTGSIISLIASTFFTPG